MQLLGCYVHVTDAEVLQQGTSAAVTGQQEDPSEASWKKAKLELLSKRGYSQNDPSREIEQYRCLAVPAVDPLEWRRSQTVLFGSRSDSNSCNKRALRTGPDLSVWRPWAESLLEAPTHPQML